MPNGLLLTAPWCSLANNGRRMARTDLRTIQPLEQAKHGEASARGWPIERWSLLLSPPCHILSLGSTLLFQLHIVDYSHARHIRICHRGGKKLTWKHLLSGCKWILEVPRSAAKCREVPRRRIRVHDIDSLFRYHCFAWHRYGGNVHRTTRDMALLLRNALMRGRGHIEGRGSLGWGSKKIPIGR